MYHIYKHLQKYGCGTFVPSLSYPLSK